MSIYYPRKRNIKRKYVYGGGLFDSIINAVTSTTAKQVAKEAAKQIATKAITETGNRLTSKALNKIIPPKGSPKELSENSKRIKEKIYGTPIEEYVKRN